MRARRPLSLSPLHPHHRTYLQRCAAQHRDRTAGPAMPLATATATPFSSLSLYTRALMTHASWSSLLCFPCFSFYSSNFDREWKGKERKYPGRILFCAHYHYPFSSRLLLQYLSLASFLSPIYFYPFSVVIIPFVYYRTVDS